MRFGFIHFITTAYVVVSAVHAHENSNSSIGIVKDAVPASCGGFEPTTAADNTVTNPTTPVVNTAYMGSPTAAQSPTSKTHSGGGKSIGKEKHEGDSDSDDSESDDSECDDSESSDDSSKKSPTKTTQSNDSSTPSSFSTVPTVNNTKPGSSPKETELTDVYSAGVPAAAVPGKMNLRSEPSALAESPAP